jgi:Transposase
VPSGLLKFDLDNQFSAQARHLFNPPTCCSASYTSFDFSPLSRRENLSLEGRKSLKVLLAAKKRLNTAYLLKESFGQLWDYEREGWARKFFENWRSSLKWQEPVRNFVFEAYHVV